jgi:flagellum-specific ATP synthase
VSAVPDRPAAPRRRRTVVAPVPGLVRALSRRLEAWREQVRRTDPVPRRGRVVDVVGLVMAAAGPAVEIGELVEIERPTPPPGGAQGGRGRPRPLLAEAVGFRERRVLLMPLEGIGALAPGATATATGRRLMVACGRGLLGRVLDGLGRPVDGRGPVRAEEWRPAEAPPPPALSRRPIDEVLPVGVRAIDGLLTCGRGQRLGIFAGSGVGKSTLLGMLCRHTAADVAVVALVGERGREVREFLETDLGPDGLARSVVVVATSDEPPVVRLKAALVATTIAEHFRDRGLDVLLVMDSLTRFALALREVGLASGEPPTTRGYTPSVFAALPRLLERSGRAARGSITGFYTVLVEGDDLNEPVADAVRGLLDGHVVLSRQLSARGHFPAIDVLQSTSRLAQRLVDEEHLAAAERVRGILATFQQAEDLVDVGAYKPGTSPAIDHALRWIEPVRAFLRQGRGELAPWERTRKELLALGLDDRGAA